MIWLFLLLAALLILGCVDWNASRPKPHHSRFQPRNRGKFAKQPFRIVFINDEWKESL